MGNFKRGLFFGGLLGAGLMWLSATKEGRAVRDQALEHAQEVYERVKKEVNKAGGWQNLTKEKFHTLVQDITEKYTKELGLATRVGNIVAKVVESQWSKLKKG